jgi:molecular chaperone GrpE
VSKKKSRRKDEPIEQPIEDPETLADEAVPAAQADADVAANADAEDDAAAGAAETDTVVDDTDANTARLDEDAMTAQLAEIEAQAAEYLDSLQRERATFMNYKKRVERERAEQQHVIKGDLLLKLLPVLDDFYRAMAAVPENEQDDWYAGVALILRKFERYLADAGVTEIDAAGAEFDPMYHEAIGVDTDTDAPSDTVTMVLQRGYMHGDRVLRPALVRVAE